MKFTPGVVQLKKGQVFSNVSLNSDAFNDDLLAENEKYNKILVVGRDQVTAFTVRDGFRIFTDVKALFEFISSRS